MSSARPRVLVISMGPVGGEMAGSGIRAYELARALSEHAEVTLAAIEAEGEPVADLPVVYYEMRNPQALRGPIAAADALVPQPQSRPLGAPPALACATHSRVRSARRTRWFCGTAASGTGSTHRARCARWPFSKRADRRRSWCSWAPATSPRHGERRRRRASSRLRP